jgi:hypothetical protein
MAFIVAFDDLNWKIAAGYSLKAMSQELKAKSVLPLPATNPAGSYGNGVNRSSVALTQ